MAIAFLGLVCVFGICDDAIIIHFYVDIYKCS